MITAVFDGDLTGGLPKGVEIYIINDIPDLSIYGLGSATNGGGTDGEEFTFPADAATAEDYIYVASESTEFTNYFGFAPDYTDASMGINGDDAVELFCDGLLIDLYGDQNTLGDGEVWDYTDSYATRPTSAGPSATFDASEWNIPGLGALSGAATASAANFNCGECGTVVNPTCGITGIGTIELSCDANTVDQDTYTVTIPFTGTDASAVLDAPGNIGVTADLTVGGEIVLTYNEGTDWAFTITSADCNLGDNGLSPTCEPVVAGACDIIISGIMDGNKSGGNPKILEIYIVNDIPDLSIYGLGSANNGGGTDGQEFTFPADMGAQGDYLYITTDATEFQTYMGFSPDYVDNVANNNGDDAIELFCGGEVIDVYGDQNVNGDDQIWDYTDCWAKRDITTCPSSTFDPSMWTQGGVGCLLNTAISIEDETNPFPRGEGPPPVCGITSLGTPVITCSAITAGNDQYTVTIPYVGSETIATVSAPGSIDVSADLSVANGNITLTYLEGEDWSVTIDGNGCTLSAGAASPVCEPGGPCDASCGTFPFNQ